MSWSQNYKGYEVGDYVSYKFSPRLDRTSGKGIVSQITNHCLYIQPDKAHYKGQVESISFFELHTGEAKVTRIIKSDDIYYEV
jgi:hypothetical protein